MNNEEIKQVAIQAQKLIAKGIAEGAYDNIVAKTLPDRVMVWLKQLEGEMELAKRIESGEVKDV